MGITSLTYDTCKPKEAGNHQSQSHPDDHPSCFHPNFVGLNMHCLELSLFKESMIDTLALLARTISPRGYRAFIQTIGLHNGLDRTPKGYEVTTITTNSVDVRNTRKHRSATKTKGSTTGATPVALSFAIVNCNVALSDLASCGTRHVRAKLVRRFHRLCCVVLHRHILPGFTLFSRLPS